MKTFIAAIITLFFLPFFSQGQKVISLKINGSINPASAAFIQEGIKKATDENCILLVHLNTPGGLLQSTRNIVGDMLESQVPVIVFVSPGGAHAGSAGVFITLAANIAAMAPGTNMGAAHPVNSSGGNIDSTMNEKVTNDAVAFIRTICEERGRNAEWAEKAVRNSIAIPEFEALSNKVVDVIALNERDLLNKIDGRTVKLFTRSLTLHTKDAVIERMDMNFIQLLLNFLADPTVAYLLMMLGFYGILFELYNPSIMVPGIVGGISLILAFYAMHTLPVNYAGLALILFGIILFLLEIKIISHGILTIGGILSLFLGSMMLVKKVPGMEFLRVSLFAVIATTLASALFFVVIIGLGLKAQRMKPVTGVQGLTGAMGECVFPINIQEKGIVMVHGERWNAVSENIISVGEKVRVTAINGLTLIVEAYRT